MPPPNRPFIPKSASAFYANYLRTPQIVRLSGDVSGSVQIGAPGAASMIVNLTPAGIAKAPVVIPLSLGAEPGTIVTDGAGNFITVPGS